MIPDRGVRLVAAELTLLAVTLVVVVGFDRLFDDSGGWTGPLLAIALVTHGIGALIRRARLGVTIQVATVALATMLVMSWFHAADTLRYLLPTADTLTALGTALDEALTLYPEARAPTEPIAGFVLAAMVGVAIVATMADIAAFRLGAEIQALIPPLTLFLFCSILGEGTGQLLAATAFVVAALVFVLVMRSVIRAAGSTWLPGDDERGPLTLVRVGGGLTAVAALAAVLVAPTLPGADDDGLWTWRGGSGDGTRIIVSPLVDIRSRLVNQSSEVAFTVESEAPSYWRMMALEAFDGESFGLNTSFRATGGALLRNPRGAGSTMDEVEQRFEIQALASPYLPAAYQAARIDIPTDDVRWDDRSSTLLLERDGAYPGLEYTVESLVSSLSPEQLRAASDQVPQAIADRYLDLPELDPRVIDLAESVVADADTPYDRALALQNFLRTEFEYSVSVAPGHSDSELVRFLFEDRAGYCEQFSASFAALARVVGLPSRVAVGFTVGEQSRTDETHYTVRGEHAHAWPEVWFDGIGWVPFEPTPGRGDPQSVDHTGVPADQEGGFGTTTTTTTDPSERESPAPTPDTLPDIFGDMSQGEGGAAFDSGGQGIPTPVVVAAGVVATGGAWVIALALIVHGRRRFLRRRAGGDPAANVRCAWREVVETARSVRVVPGPTETHREFASRLGSELGDRAGPVRELGERVATARYAPELVSRDDAEDAMRSAELAVTAVRSIRTTRQRWAALIDPRWALPTPGSRRARRSATVTRFAG